MKAAMYSRAKVGLPLDIGNYSGRFPVQIASTSLLISFPMSVYVQQQQ